jgi:hypothetical protein
VVKLFFNFQSHFAHQAAGQLCEVIVVSGPVSVKHWVFDDDFQQIAVL